MAESPLFTALDALWTKAQPDKTPPMYIMNRFLASDPDYALFARHLQLDVRDPRMQFRTWQGLLPRGKGAPRLQYTAPKKPPKEEELVRAIMTYTGERRQVAEDMLEIAKLAGREADLYPFLGVDPDE